MDDECPPRYIEENHEVYDRFTFDALFRKLLADGYDREGAKDVILWNCALSALVLQERIHNAYYLKLPQENVMAEDLMEFRWEVLTRKLTCWN